MSRERDHALIRATHQDPASVSDEVCDRIRAEVDAQHPPAPLSREVAMRVAREARARGGRVTFLASHDARIDCATCDGEGSVGIEGDVSGEDSEICEDCMGSGCIWPDALFAKIDAEAPNDDANLTRIVDAVLGAQSEVEAAERRVVEHDEKGVSNE